MGEEKDGAQAMGEEKDGAQEKAGAKEEKAKDGARAAKAVEEYIA